MSDFPLPRPSTPQGRAALDALLAEPATALVALDLDGTLAPIVPRPEDIAPQDGAPQVLSDLAARVGTVAVITGRPAADAVRLGQLGAVPGLVVLGHYGLQRWHDGVLDSPPPHEGVGALRPRLAALVAAAPDGTTLEDKGHSLAVHTRGTATPQPALDALAGPVSELAADAGLEVVPGRFVLELRPPGTDKGGALRAVVAEVGARSVLFCGDDIGDLPAVAAVHALRAEGVPGLVACSDSTESPAALREAADVLVDGPPGVVGLLRAVAARLAEQPAG